MSAGVDLRRAIVEAPPPEPASTQARDFARRAAEVIRKCVETGTYWKTHMDPDEPKASRGSVLHAIQTGNPPSHIEDELLAQLDYHFRPRWDFRNWSEEGKDFDFADWSDQGARWPNRLDLDDILPVLDSIAEGTPKRPAVVFLRSHPGGGIAAVTA